MKKFPFIPYLALEVDTLGLRYLEESSEVSSIQEDLPVPPTLAESVPLIGAPAAWASGYSGSGQTVAILDTGVDKTHPFLSGKVVSEACYSTSNSSSTSVCPGGVSQSTATGSGVNCSTTINGCEHGTHVAGIAAGKGTSSSGVAKDASIIAVQVFSRFDSETDCGIGQAPCVQSYTSDEILGLQRVQALSSSFSIAAVNMSLGVGRYFANCDAEQAATKSAIDNLRSVGIATVIASGNDGYTDSLSSPGCISTAVSVGSTDDGSNGTSADVVSIFNSTHASNSASFLNLLAPGRWINSSIPGGGFLNLQGTSMATPHVTGAWAVLKSKSPSASVDQILAALTTTGVPVTDSRNNVTKPRIKVDAAVNALGAGSSGQYTPGTVVSLTPAPTSGYSFQSWTGCDSVSGSNCTVTMNASKSVTANFVPAQVNYSIAVSASPVAGGTVSGGGTFASGSSRTVTASANSGFMFANWTESGTVVSTSASYTFTLSGNRTLVANFIQSPVQVTVQTNPSGRAFTVDGSSFNSTQTFSWSPGSIHTIATSSPQGGTTGTQFVWNTWSDGGAINHSVAPTSNTTYTANFTTQFMLTMNAGSGGNVSPSSGFFNSGQSVNISATPNSGFGFSSWTGSGTGAFSGTTNPATVTMNGPLTETASFAAASIPITVQTNPTGRSFTVDGTSFSSTQTFSWTPGSSHTISTTSPQGGGAGMQFVWNTWSDGGAISHSVAPTTATTYTANFTTQFLLTMSAGAGGTVSPASGFFNSGQSVNISATPNSGFTFTNWTGTGTGSFSGATNPASVTMNGPITETAGFAAIPKTTQLGASTFAINEGLGFVNIALTRSGDTSGTASVAFATSNGTAKEGKDYAAAFGVLNFAAGENSKTFPVLIIDNAFVDGPRTVNLSLNSPSGVTLGTQSSAVLTISDNDASAGANPIDQPHSFVEYHYFDFLGRYPDQSGWDFWTNNIAGCIPQPSCVGVQRINTSAAYFLSIEFQQTGYLVYKIYKASFGNITDIPNAPVPIKRQEFLPDTQEIGNGVIVNQGNWQQQLEANKQAFTLEFVQRARFTAAFPTTMTPAQFVDKLFSNAGVTPSAADRNAAIAEFGAATATSDVAARSRALRDVAENTALNTQEFNKAFVLMQYFGYLRRNPYDSPEPTLDYSGFNFWLGKLNSFGGNYINAEMVKAFISSAEYRQRFGP